MTLIEVLIAVMALLSAVAGATVGWQHWQFIGAVCGFAIGFPVGMILTVVTFACTAAMLFGLEAMHAIDRLPTRLQDLGIMAVLAAALIAGLAGLSIAGPPGGVVGIFSGWLAAASVVSLTVCTWTCISAGLTRIRLKGNWPDARQRRETIRVPTRRISNDLADVLVATLRSHIDTCAVVGYGGGGGNKHSSL